MFTGIVSSTAQVLKIHEGYFTLSRDSFTEQLKVGQSVAHDGACMTVDSFNDKEYKFFAMQESFTKTNFSSKIVGDVFNIEFCIKGDDRLDGHFVSGHIDVVGKVSSCKIIDDGSKELQVSYDESYDSLVVPKGSICLNGVSLTVVNVFDGGCSVWLIPLTQKETNLGVLAVGDQINVEFDILAKYVTKFGRG